MPCMTGEGQLTPSGRKILAVLEKPETLEDVAVITSLPPEQIRSGIREMQDAGLIQEHGGTYVISLAGRALLETQRT